MSTSIATPTGGPMIQVLAKRTLRFMEGAGSEARGFQVAAKAVVQEVPAFIKATPTWAAAVSDGSILEVSGRSTLVPVTVPPTVDEVVAQRGCTAEEAAKIVAIETVKFNQGEYPYPAIVTVKPSLETLLATGLTREQAERALADSGTDAGANADATAKPNGKKAGK